MNKSFNGFFSWQSTINTATASSWAATCNWILVQVTSESLTTAAAAEYTLTLTNNKIKAGSVIFASVWLGTSTAWTPWIWWVTASNGSVVITVTNLHASDAFNGTIKINAIVFDAK